MPTAKFEGLEDQLGKERQKVDVASVNFSVREIVRMYEAEELSIAPSYQRKYRWPKTVASTFVESVFLGLPIPPIFVATNADFQWEVVDGLQRISTLIHFLGEDDESVKRIGRSGSLTLEGLEASNMTALSRRASAIICILAILLPLTATPANANTKLGPAPVLGACGVFTPENKVVYKYWNNTGRTLYCGNDRYGFRHIRKNHRTQFQTLAAIGGLQWWDLMHWAIYYNYKDPDYVRYQGDGKTCRSRSLYLGTRSGKPYSQIFRVITGSNGVITAYPSSKHCQW